MCAAKASHYSFGDEGRAAERLRRLAALYAPSSEALLRRAVQHLGAPVALAVDLGCGPGYTTKLVAAVTRATRTIGLERLASQASGATAIANVLRQIIAVPATRRPSGAADPR